MLEIKEVRITKPTTKGAVLAFAEINIDDMFAVHGIKIIDSDRGPFVAMPNRKENNEYRDVFHPINREARKYLIDLVMDAYKKTKEK